MQNLLIFIFFSIFFNITGQMKNLNFIKFTYTVSNSFASKVEIEISNTEINKGKIPIKVTRYSTKEKIQKIKELTLTEIEYNEICTEILKIKLEDVFKHPNYLVLGDGNSIKISFRSANTAIDFTAGNFDFNDTTTSSKEFLYAVKSILKYAEVDIYGINKFKETAKK